MNYELKSIQPMTVFINALRILVVVGFLIATVSFFLLPNGLSSSQKLTAVPVFTIVYTVIFSAMATLVAFLYNVWAQKFSGIKIHLEQTGE